jgi:DHA1 family inner membrane transport protein
MSKQEGKKSLLFPALGFSMTTGGPPIIALSLLLVDISEEFGVPVGVLGQISTASSFLGIFMAIIMGVLAVRYTNKTLLTTGLVLTTLGIIGTSLSTSFTLILLLYSLTGIGFSMTLPMITTLIGENYPAEGRTKVMGRIISVRSIAAILAPIVTGYVVSRSTWRIGFSSYALPIVAISLVLVTIGLSSDEKKAPKSSNLLDGIKDVFKNRSAVAYLLAGTLSTALFSATQVFNGSFLRQQFTLPIATVSKLLPVTAVSVTVGLLISNRLVERVGLKKVVYMTTFISAAFYLVYYASGLSLTPSLVFLALGSLTTGVRLATVSTLGLVQETKYRGSMMALSTASMSMGGVLGAMLGGYALLNYGYAGFGSVITGLSFIATFIYVFWVRSPSA